MLKLLRWSLLFLDVLQRIFFPVALGPDEPERARCPGHWCDQAVPSLLTGGRLWL